ncbi:MAG TPA: CRISPR-associated endonuclease Cas2 [Candidatus Methanomethylicus sp.]|nr:CRISPR-associated endonuclease Cas2 [Candidatus Methanomethylicus sp.]
MITLVIYDISDDASRTRLSGYLKQYGLRRVQYSGFRGELNANDRHVLVQEVPKFLSAEKDSVYIIPLCSSCLKSVSIASKKKAEFYDDERVKIV